MEYASDNVNLINGNNNGNHKEGLKKFKALLQKIKGYKNKQVGEKPKKILIATDADACLFRGYVSSCAGHMGMGVMSDMVYVYRNIFKLCEEAGIECDFCFLTKLQPCQCNPFFKEQLSKRLGKDKYRKPFIKPKDIKFAPFVGGSEVIDHKSFNKKMFEEEGYKNTEVLYFDNDLDYHKIEDFKKNLQSNTQEVGATAYPVNIIHTEDVKNWITEKTVREDIVKKYFEQVWNLNKDKQEQWKEHGGKEAFIEAYFGHNKQSSQFEQKTADNGIDFNKDGLKVDELLKATQDVLFDARSELKDKQNYWIKQNFETDKELAYKLFEKYSEKTCKLMFITINKHDKMKGKVIYEVLFDEEAVDTFNKIKGDEEIKDILNKYSQEPKLDTILNKEGKMKGNGIFEDAIYEKMATNTFKEIENYQGINSILSNYPPETKLYTSVDKGVEMANIIPRKKIVREKAKEKYIGEKKKINIDQVGLGKNEEDKIFNDENGIQIVMRRDDKNQEPRCFTINRGRYYSGEGILIRNARKDANNWKPSITRMQINGKNYTFICV